MLTGSIDPYDQGPLRVTFIRAAGTDSELSPDELAAWAKDGSQFVQKVYKWPEMLWFDKNANKALDWAEFEAYHQSLRSRILKAFDSNNDVKLTGDERKAAIAAVLAGRIPALPTPPVLATRPSNDGEMLHKAQELRRQAEIRRYDKNGDGKLDEAETAEMKKDQERIAKEAAQHVQEAQKYGKNYIAKLDTDHDGKVSIAERVAAYKSVLGKYDANKDGKLDDKERAKIWKRETGLDDCPRREFSKSFVPVFHSDKTLTIINADGVEGVMPMAIPQPATAPRSNVPGRRQPVIWPRDIPVTTTNGHRLVLFCLRPLVPACVRRLHPRLVFPLLPQFPLC